MSPAPERSGNDCDVVVIGGGVVGLSLAYGLAKTGLAVTILDEGDVAHRASRGNFGLVWVQGKGLDNPDYARWSLASARAWPSFCAEVEAATDTQLSYEQRGGLMASLTEEDLDARCNDLLRLHNHERDCADFERLDAAVMKRLLPAIGPAVVGGTFCKHDGHVNALRLFSAIHAAAASLGAIYRPNATVEAIDRLPDGFSITGAAGEIRAGKVVLAAGLGNARLGPMVGIHAPVRPQRGQILVTEKIAHFLDYPLGNIRQTDEGGVMIGDSREEVGFDNGTRHDVLAGIAANAIRIFPLLAQAQVVRSWGALRVMTPDGYPIYERSVTHPGAYLVTCHSGVTLAAVHASHVAGMIASGDWLPDLTPFAAGRFANVPSPV